jgi:NAD(P)-dependent dehydrogenase (short-subunit alcohol dehydrogenase family)
MTQELAGKVAIVTGGANGLGRGAVELFVEEGAQVVIADLDEARGQALATRLGKAARFKRTDVSDRDQVQAVVDFAVAEFGGLHAMCNNAGLSDNAFAPMLEQDFARFDQIMRVNLLGVMLGTQIAGRHMVRHGGGSIINTSSIGGVIPGWGFTLYRAAKAAVINFTKQAAIELGADLVRVNCVCPGNILTEMATYAAPDPGMTEADVQRMQDAVLAVRMSRQPLKRQGSPRDIGQTMLFLASDRPSQMLVLSIARDGGATAGDARSVIQEMLEARAALGLG